jgi:hypothetical protein
VEGSQPEWHPYFRVDCNHSDILKFKVIHFKGDNEKIEIGVSTLLCETFIKKNINALSS